MKTFVRFWIDFVVGDDWTVAAGVILMLVVAALLAGTGAAGWIWAAGAVSALLAGSVWRAMRRPPS